MMNVNKKAPPDEQEICRNCGFCCDGTIFSKASLQTGERGNLPEKIEENYLVKEGKEYFRLPCQYFDKLCTIYDQKKPDFCSGYRCQLLIDYSKKVISKNDAMDIITKAMEMRNELLIDHMKLKGHNSRTPFNEIFEVISKESKSLESKEFSMGFDIFIARCNIFEALLVKHFRSAKDFESMVVRVDNK